MPTTLELIATKPQQEILAYEGKFAILIAGRRWGKTTGIVCNHIVARCLTRPHVEYLMAAPSMPQTRIPFDILATHYGLRPYIQSIDKRYYPIITWFNGSRTHFRTLDLPDLLRGAAYDYVWIDEIQNVNEHTIDAILLPTLSDKRGKMGMSGQGRGEEHWIYQRFYFPGQQEKNWPWIRSWRFSIRDGMRFQDAVGIEEIARLKEVTPPSVWDEEYEGLFVSSGKSVFRSQDIQACIRGEFLNQPMDGRQYVMAIDVGRVADPSAWLIMDAFSGQVVYAEVRPFRERHDFSAAQADMLRQRFNDAICIIDKTGYGVGSASRVDEYVRQYEQYVKKLIPFFWSPSTKKRVVDSLALAVEQHKIGIPENAKELRRQMGVYEFQKMRDMVSTAAPRGDHDDLVSALAMAWNAKEMGFSSRGGSDLSTLI